MNRLVISIVPQNYAELVIGAANGAGAQGGTVLMGRGTASNSVLQLLGLGDTSKEIVLTVVDRKIEGAVMDAVKQAVAEKKHFGVIFTMDVPSFWKSGGAGVVQKYENVEEGEETMSENGYEMINVIVNKGYAEDAMAAARRAGAGGGTIISARGTAKEGDEKFFGMEIVPEKEMLMILVPKDKKDSIIEAVRTLPCLEKAGSGIVFSNSVAGFSTLGKN